MPKVSALPVATRIDTNDIILVVQDGITKQISRAVLEDSWIMDQMDVLFDGTSSPITYVGIAPVSTPTSSAGWQIKRLTYTVGVYMPVVEYAGTGEFNQIWDDRTSLSYS